MTTIERRRASRRARATRTQDGYVERDGVRIFYEVYGDRRADGPAAADLVDHPLAPLEGADPVSRAPRARRHLRRTRQRALGPPGTAGRLRRARVRRRRARGDGRDGHRARRAGRRSRAARCGASLLAAEHPERVDGAVFIAPAAPLAPARRARRATPFDEPLDAYEGWAQVQPPLLARGLPRLPRVLLRAGVHRAALDQADRGLRRLGARDDAGDARAHPARAASCTTARSSRALLRADRVPGAGASTATEDAIRPLASGAALAEVDRRRRSSRSRAPDTARTRATRCRSTCCCATSSAPRPPPRSWTRGRGRRKRALYVSSPIGLGHARRDVAIARELRALHPDLEIDWLAQHPVTAVLEAAGERVHPASRAAGQRVAPHRVRVGRARPALLPGLAADGRDPGRQLHGLPRPRPRAATTTCGSATRAGRSTTTCTRTRSRSAPPTRG